MITCSHTTIRIKAYAFEVAIGGTPPSVALADRVKSHEWRERKATPKGRVAASELGRDRGQVAGADQIIGAPTAMPATWLIDG